MALDTPTQHTFGDVEQGRPCWRSP